MKKTTAFQNSLIWFGAAVSLAEILTGTYFAPLGMGKGILAIVIGHVIGCALFFFAGLIGGRTGLSAMETVKLSLYRGIQGERGHICLTMISFSLSVKSKRASASRRACTGCSVTCQPSGESSSRQS